MDFSLHNSLLHVLYYKHVILHKITATCFDIWSAAIFDHHTVKPVAKCNWYYTSKPEKVPLVLHVFASYLVCLQNELIYLSTKHECKKHM
jgi:hypothetical protein